MQPRIRGINLVNITGFIERYCVIPREGPYMDGKTWKKVVKLVASGIRKIKVRNFACVFPILFSIYITLHICPSKLSTDDMQFPSVVGIPHI